MTLGMDRRGWLWVAIVMLLVAVPAVAQITTGTVSGAIKDDQGLRIPGATVVLISESRGTRLAPVVTNATGDFVVPNVTADTYTIEVSLPGFSTLRRPGVVVSGGDRVGIGELALLVGGASETIVVTSEAPLLQAQSGERSFTISSDAVSNLPVSNRSFALLAQLSAGVSGNIAGGTPQRLGGGGQNNVMVDGASVMDTGNNGLALQLNVDAVAEVKVLTSGYQAEYGRSSGLQITAVTKSGTNAFHGSVYDIIRNSDWNSNTWANIENGLPKPESKEQDWGFSIGGPVGRPGGDNRLFFFYSQELRPRSAGGNITNFRVPTAAERAGDFSASLNNNGAVIGALRDATTGGTFANNVIPADRFYGPGINLLNLWPMPNIPQAPGTSFNYQVEAPQQNWLIHQPAVRGDYQVSSALRVTGRFAGQRNRPGVTPGSMPGYNDTINNFPWVRTVTTTINYTVSPTVFFEATYGWVNRRLGAVNVSPLANRNNSGLAGIPYIYPDANILPDGYNKKAMEAIGPAFYVNGRAELPPQFQWGNLIGTAPPSFAYPGFLNTNPVQDISASLTKVAGRHTLKAGIYYQTSQKSQNLNQRNALPFQGQLNFGNNTNNPLDTGFGFANAALGIFSDYTQQGNFIEGDFRYRNIEGYLQDNWKVTNRLTFDYGLRFTHQQPQYDANGQASNFFIDRYNPASAPALYTPACVGASPCSGNNRRAFNPVTGQVLGTGTAVLIGQIVPNSGNLTNGIVLAGTDGVSKYNYEWPALAVGPRFGFAYDTTGTQSVVVRGGIGLFYDRPDGDSIYYQSQNPPTSSSTIIRYSRLQELAAGGGTASQGVPTIINYRYDNDGLPQSVQWNAGVQMALPFSAALDLSYVGQHGSNLLQNFQSNSAVNVNAIDFGTTFLASSQDPTQAAGTPYVAELLRPIRGYGNIDQQWQGFDRTYHSLQSSLTRRFRNGFSGSLNYTLSLSDTGTWQVPVRLQHAADGSYSVRADQADFEELMKDQALQRHVIRANLVWDLPDLRADAGAARVLGAIINDWQVSAIFTGGSGPRYDATYTYQTGGANQNLTGSPDYAARVVITGDPGSGCSEDRYRQFNTSAFSGPLPGSLGMESGRNVLSGCADKTTDLSISRSIRMGGGRSVQLRAEVFNAFNTVVYNGRITQLQLVSPTNQTVRNPQFLADGTLDQAKLKPNQAGFGAVTSAQALRSMQLQVRFTF